MVNFGRFEIITDTHNPLNLSTQGQKVFSSDSPVILEGRGFY
ncbi:MAG: hypothetical protein Ct9H90mP2_03120 [Dehalococcoidia bacterium]|nr:MAG: hypothetical protein Ct9H90mP2_03120 [Dehalococcoidia bacterium]